ncbi:MAG: GntR family transcriptional regulator [Alphaproteobacteria bacterium]|nr:GntR family transcriptional regulator [Alphaproteobacteria bacterium]
MTPRYQQIAERLIADIQSGRSPIGGMLPTEKELCRRFRVSRFTVREAMRVLSDRGMLTRHAGLGTIVKSKASRGAYVQSLDSLDELLRYPPETRLRVRSMISVRANAELARLLRCRRGQRWMRISGVRSVTREKRPICWTDVYVVPEYAAVARIIGARPAPVYRLVEERFGEAVASVRIDMFASRVTPDVAPILSVAPGSAAMTIVRRYTGLRNRTFEISVSVHPEGRFTYSIDLMREWQTAR